MRKLLLLVFLIFGQLSHSSEGTYKLNIDASECLTEAFGESDCGGVLPSLRYAKSLMVEKSDDSYNSTIENQFDNNGELIGKNDFKDQSYISGDGYQVIKITEWKHTNTNGLLYYETIEKEDNGYDPSQVRIVKHTISLAKDNMFIEREINYYRWNSANDSISASPFSYEYSRSNLSKN